MAIDIVVSIGPESATIDKLTQILLAGGSVIRCNYAHQEHAVYEEWLANLEKAQKKAKKKAKTMMDVEGFKIRLGNLDRYTFVAGQEVILDSAVKEPSEGEVLEKGRLKSYMGEPIPVSSPLVTRAAKVGNILYAGDGQLGFQVKAKPTPERLVCASIASGELGVHKALTLSGEVLKEKALTLQDYEHIKQGSRLKYHFLSVSFTQTAADIEECRDFVSRECKSWRPKIIAKIETSLGLKNIKAIIKAADGIMIARGDLALHADFRRLYLYEEEIIKLCRKAKKYCIVATQMLESLGENGLVPSRAEIIDISTAVKLGASATMLSGETTVGSQPEHVVKTMREVIEAVK